MAEVNTSRVGGARTIEFGNLIINMDPEICWRVNFSNSQRMPMEYECQAGKS